MSRFIVIAGVVILAALMIGFISQLSSNLENNITTVLENR